MTQLQDDQRARLLDALESAAGNRRRAGEILGVGRATLYRWMERFGLDRETLRRIGNRYELLRLLGSGGQASVFLVRDRAGEGAELALKLLRTEAADARADTLLEREFRTLSRLRHPALVRVHDFGVDRPTGRPFLVMDFVPGQPFELTCQERSPAWIALAFLRALEGVQHLHRHALVHRDLKGANILVDPGPGSGPARRVTVMDLGLSDDLAGPAGRLAGTPSHMAPELFQGARASARSDLYSLGSMLYLALTGATPKPLSAPSRLRSGIPRLLDRVVLRLLAEDPGQRFPDAGAVIEELSRWIAPDGTRDSTEVSESDFVGRHAEMEEVLSWLRGLSSDANANQCPCLLIVADGGVGKSRFLEACRGEVELAGLAVFGGVCRSGNENGLAPVAEILADLTVSLGESIETLTQRFLPVLQTLVPKLGREDRDDPEEQISRYHLLDGVASFLVAVAETQELVLIFDDLQLADPILVDLLWHLARRGRHVPLRVLAAARPTPPGAVVTPWIRGAAVEGLLQLMPLPHLPRESALELTRRSLGAARAAVLGEAIYSVTGGHPLFVQQLLREIKDDTHGVLDSEPMRLPHTLEETIGARLDRLSEEARTLLAVLATAARPCSPVELATLAASPAEHALNELAERSVLRVLADGQVDFAHAFLRDAALGQLDETSTKTWHARWADHLRSEGGNRLVERAEHLLAAGVPARKEFLEAATRLHGKWQYRAAIPFFRAALATCTENASLRADIFPKLAQACRGAQSLEQAIEVCRDWARDARAGRDPAAEARALGALADNLRETSEWATARDAAESAVELAKESEDVLATARALRILASILWLTWRHDESRMRLGEALVLARTSGKLRPHAAALHDSSLLLAITGQVTAGLEAARKARELYEQAGDPVWSVATRANESTIQGYLGDLPGAVSTLKHVVDALAQLDMDVPIIQPLETLVFLLNRAGRFSEAIETGKQLLEVASRFARHEKRVAGLLGMGDALFELGDRDAARDHHRLALDLATALGDERQELYAQLAVCRDLRTDTNLGGAAALARKVYDETSERGSRKQRALAAIELARIALDRDEPEEAHHQLDNAEDALKISFEEGPALRATVLLERTRAFARQDKFSFALAQVEEGIALARHRGPAAVAIRLLTERSRLLDREGRVDESARSLSEAARLITKVADAIPVPSERNRYLAEPERAALLASCGPGGHEESRARERAVESFHSLVDGLANEEAIERFLKRVVEAALQCCRADRGLLLLRDPAETEFRVVASAGIESGVQEEALRIPDAVIEPLEAGDEFVASSFASDPELSLSDSLADLGVHSVIAFPLIDGGRTQGVLYTDARRAAGTSPPAALVEMRTLARLATVALTRERRRPASWRKLKPSSRAAAETRSFGDFISCAPAMHELFHRLERVACSDLPVLVLGESGTGKELVSKALHARSARGGGVFLTENCAAIPESLLESLLFGHVKGAFTGADEDKAGLFELASGGTLLLDEIGEMSPTLQAKLLRVLQEAEFRPVGSHETFDTDVRIVAATHQDPARLIAEGAFRQDLYYRLSGITITLPPLRERREDIPLLAEHFLRRESTATGRKPPELTRAALEALSSHDWPGNVRELENLIRRLLLLLDGTRIGIAELESDTEFSRCLAAPLSSPAPPLPKDDSIDEERKALLDALERANGNRARAATLLSIGRATLYRRLKKHGL